MTLNKEDFKIYHIRNYKNPTTGGVTMLVSKEADDDYHLVRLSICDVEDNYNKKFGIERALNSPDRIGVSRFVNIKYFLEGLIESPFVDELQGESPPEDIVNSLYGEKSDSNSTGKQLGKAQRKIKELEDELQAALTWIASAEYTLNLHFKQNGGNSI